MDQVDVLIIGAGVVGLALACELSRRYPGRDIMLVEKNRRFGQETSSRNSEVIHAGIYYPKGTLKATLCKNGNRLLYQFCDRYNVRYSRLGKLIVATQPDEFPRLEAVYRRGLGHGIPLKWLEPEDIRRLEPNLYALAGILSPTTGIIDSQGLMRQLYRLALEQGVMAVFAHPVTYIEKLPGGYLARSGDDSIKARVVVNSSGLASHQVAAMAGFDIDKLQYRLRYCKGEYYRLSPRIHLNHLVYPLPEPAGLGIHVTKDLSGGQRLGPNAYYVDEPAYDVDETYKQQFYETARSYLPALRITDIQPDYAGIRPQLQRPGEDFKTLSLMKKPPAVSRAL